MAKKAVLVGCNYPGTKAELHGCINDVWRIHRSLVERFGFDESDITVLIDTDSSYTQPTGANIKRALNRLVREAESGDIIFFHYSGHGTRLPAETGEDDDTGYDECIVPCDMNLISDDDFREIVDKVPEGAKFTLVSDSCHSGGLVNNAKEQIGESTQQRGEDSSPPREGGGGFRDGLKAFISGKVQEKLQERGLDFDFGHGHSHGHGHGPRHMRYRDQDEHFQHVPYQGDGLVKSRALPLSTLLELLKEKTGKDDIDVGNIRPTLFDMFGEDSSSKVKKFVKVLLQNLQNDGEDSHHGLFGAVGSLAQQFLKTKLDEHGDSDDYFKPALDTHVSDQHEAYAGSRSRDMGILISGCQSSQTSADANPTGNPDQAYGAMSNALQTVLSQHDGPITNYELVSRVRELLKKQGYSQRPGLYCTDYHAEATFIC